MDDGDLTQGEIELLIDGSVDDVDFVWTLIHLGIRENPPLDRGPPTSLEIDQAFGSIARLVDRDYIVIGHTEYVDGGPPGRFSPVLFVPEPVATVKSRVERHCAYARENTVPPGHWEFSSWLTCTEAGRAIAKDLLRPENSHRRRWQPNS